MTRSPVPLSRISALSVAITLFAAPIASAQTPQPANRHDAEVRPVFLNSSAFARLAKERSAAAATAVDDTSQLRPSLQRQSTTAMARQARAASAKAPQKSWASRHKTALIVCGVIAGGLLGLYAFAMNAPD